MSDPIVEHLEIMGTQEPRISKGDAKGQDGVFFPGGHFPPPLLYHLPPKSGHLPLQIRTFATSKSGHLPLQIRTTATPIFLSDPGVPGVRSMGPDLCL